MNQLLRPTFDPKAKQEAERDGVILARGLAAGPGAATGRVVFNAADAEEWVRRGEIVILVRLETSPDDIRGMHAARGILTAVGDDLACSTGGPPDGESLHRGLRGP